MATATLAPKITRSGRPKLPALDKNRITAEQATYVASELNGITDPKKRLVKLYEIESQAHAIIAELETPMKKQALSVALHEGARGVYKAIGLSREAFSRMTAEALGDKTRNPNAHKKGQPEFIYVWADRPKAREGQAPWDETVVARANAKAVRYYRTAAADLPEIARKVVTAKAQEAAIRPLRDTLVKELYEVHGMTRTEIAEIIGRTPSRVSHITKAG